MDNENLTINDRLEAIKQLNRGRFDYVMQRARSPQPSKDKACDNIGRNKAWYYDMPKDEQDELEYLADQLHKGQVIHAFYLLKEATEEAARVKVAGLHDRDGKIRQSAATEILDRMVGKAADKTNVDVSGQVSIIWKPHKPEV